MNLRVMYRSDALRHAIEIIVTRISVALVR